MTQIDHSKARRLIREADEGRARASHAEDQWAYYRQTAVHHARQAFQDPRFAPLHLNAAELTALAALKPEEQREMGIVASELRNALDAFALVSEWRNAADRAAAENQPRMQLANAVREYVGAGAGPRFVQVGA